MNKPVDLTVALRALAQPVRLSIIAALAGGELCVCELERVLGLTQPAISQHLKVLREAGLVTERRTGQWALQALAVTRLEQLASAVLAIAHGADQSALSAEQAGRLAEVRARPLIDCERQLRSCCAREE
jgi:ArsR family transcriptional regulator